MNTLKILLSACILFAFNINGFALSADYESDMEELKQLDKTSGIAEAQKLGLSYAINNKYTEAGNFFKYGSRWSRVLNGRLGSVDYHLKNSESLLKTNITRTGMQLLILDELEAALGADKNKERQNKWVGLLKKLNSQASDARVLSRVFALAETASVPGLVKYVKENNSEARNKKELKTSLDKTHTTLGDLKVELEEKQSSLYMKEEAISALSAEAAQQKVRMQQQELAIQMQKNMVDSLRYKTIIDSLEIQEEKTAAAQANAILSAEKKANNLYRFLLVFVALLLALLGAFYMRTRKFNKTLKQQKEVIHAEQKKSDELLENILPSHIAAELKETGEVKPHYLEKATVLFSDFVGFTGYSKSVSTEQLVKDLNDCFTRFDRLTVKHNVEKIKTIGDAYMCASGLFDGEHGALEMVTLAGEMLRELNTFNADRKEKGLPELSMRIGIHTGALASGVVGQKKFAFDVWGDTVNVAARVEQAGGANTVNVSEATAELVKSKFSLEPRGKIKVKSLGEQEMYFVKFNQ